MQRKAGPPKLRVFRLLGPLSGGPGGLPNLEQRGRDSTVAVGSRSRFRGPPAEEGYALPGAPLTSESPKRWHYSPAPMGWLRWVGYFKIDRLSSSCHYKSTDWKLMAAFREFRVFRF